jgi:aryl-alcohol dehydrogenase-like predicted oxidoreductase
MQTRPLAAGLPAVTVVGYGGMHISIDGRPPEEQGIRVVHAALDAGETLIDTADVYCLSHADIGHNERLIAQALHTWHGPREAIVVATKGGLTRPNAGWERDARPEQLRQACDRSLKALGVERIDLYQLHAIDPRVPLEDSVGAMADLQKRGKVRAIGLSNVSVADIRRAQKIATISTVQNRLSPFFREALADGVVRFCGEQGIGFIAYSPTGGGRLTRKLPGHPVLQQIGRRLGASPHAVAIAWGLAQGPTVFSIPSARTVDHALDSARAAELALSADDLTAIDRAVFDRT